MSVLEHWRPIPGYEDFYEVSDLGRVRSKPRILPHNYGGLRTTPQKYLGCQMPNGYVRCILTDETGRRKNFDIHRLVLLAFVGKPPEGCYTLHGPRGQTVHELSNLSYGTQKQNLADQDRDGVLVHGERSGMHKLTAEQVKYIFLSNEVGMRLAERFGVTPTQISAIKHRKTWARTTKDLV
jgi:hypothetical protein